MVDNYKQLESKMVNYADLVNVTVRDNSENFIVLPREIMFGYLKESNDMEKILGSRIIIRKSVLRMILEAQSALSLVDQSLRLYITYGYRDFEIQVKRFNEVKESLLKNNDLKNIANEDVHRYVAVPLVAGHPTGGAIDLSIFDTDKNDFLDFGSKQYDYSTKKCYVFSNEVNKTQKNNRFLLRRIMLSVGFAPFDGEWWHFSYGDREWAFYYNKKFAIYDQKVYKEVQIGD